MSLSPALALRREISERNRRYAAAHHYIFVESYGEAPVIVYEADDERRLHGNFLDAAYRAILGDAAWRKRLAKAHTHRKSLPHMFGGKRKELDSCMSSDALLMNVFCYPRTFADGRVCRRLGVAPDVRPQFGFKARVPLANGRSDRTEVDMLLGDLLIESKLTENDFQQKAKAVVEAYRDFPEVFDRRALPQSREQYLSYQLIRNVLAAQALGMSFCVLLDARRPDLREEWHAVMRAVRPVDLRLRCKTLTWQELASDLPARLRRFLAEKYGIEAASSAPA
ncbi:MAG: hypothetical protein LAN37_05065 [Acidobacteriia bacterium]|nr:hypothetical protein [Terriglobia bacterium]